MATDPSTVTDTPATVPEGQPAPAPNAGVDASAGSSPASEDAASPTLAELLAKRIGEFGKKDGDEDGDTSAPAMDSAPAEQDEAKAEAGGDEPADPGEAQPSEAEQAQEDEKLPFHKHPRWREVQDNLREARAQVKDLEGKVAELSDAGERFGRLVGYCNEHGIDSDALNSLLHAGALLRSDPAKALEFMRPWIEAAQLAAGEKLPSDLASEVEDGLLDGQRAKEIATLRARQAAAEEARNIAEQRAAREKAKADLDAVTAAISNLERQWLASDPDYARIKDRVSERLAERLELWALRERRIPTQEEATAMVKSIREAELALVKRIAPKPAAKPIAKPADPGPSRSTPKRNIQPGGDLQALLTETILNMRR